MHLHRDPLRPGDSRRRTLESTAGEEVPQGLSCKFLNPMWNARCMGALAINQLSCSCSRIIDMRGGDSHLLLGTSIERLGKW